MGRSVSIPCGAEAAFTCLEEPLEHSEWQDYLDRLREQAMRQWPSLAPHDHWLGREDRVLASNRHAYFGVSEYCGVVAVWIVARDDACHPGLAATWTRRAAAELVQLFGCMRHVGTMSNGIAVYRKAA